MQLSLGHPSLLVFVDSNDQPEVKTYCLLRSFPKHALALGVHGTFWTLVYVGAF